MRLLVDTQIALWAILDDPRLAKAAIDLVSDPKNQIVVSAVSIWEISIKFRLSRGRWNDIPLSGPDALSYFRTAGFELLSITVEHAIAVATLPDHHRDPFDRLLIAQALHEPLTLLTHDSILKAYSNSVMLF